MMSYARVTLRVERMSAVRARVARGSAMAAGRATLRARD